MSTLRVAILWHMHQPYYKDLVSGEYRLPWVRLHALKDYYGMVKLLDEFPTLRQTFNLVPSLIAQIEDYVRSSAHDPFLGVAAKPARDLSPDERRFALEYLFQAHPTQMIGRYPRYRELWERFRGLGQNSMRAPQFFLPQDYADLQVLSQLAWFDEFFLDEPDVAELVRKGHNYSEDDQRFVIARQRELLGKVIPAYASAAQRGLIEISTSPFYHPILPLLYDTSVGAVSSPGLRLPETPFRHPEDAREQLQRGLDLHQRVFGRRPRGVWPSEGSISEEVVALAHQLGVNWMASDEGVLGRSLGFNFARDSAGALPRGGPEKLYIGYLYKKEGVQMHLVFRDHALSDLIGFVYSGMPAAQAAAHLLASIKDSAAPLLKKGADALVPIILDGENAWEFYPRSGREFLRRFYDALAHDPEVESVTFSEGLSRQFPLPALPELVPGSWINANFNVWIGAPEDNRAWDYLAAARSFYQQAAPAASAEKRELAWEELLIAEGSDWNWWYGPEHHTANDRDFDELYRKHLTNVYQTLGAAPPSYLAHPIAAGLARPTISPQTAYIHPHISADFARYFDWLGAASYTADRYSGSMHGKVSLLDALYAGIDEQNLYGRLDFAGGIPQEEFKLIISLESRLASAAAPGAQESPSFRLEAPVETGKLRRWSLYAGEGTAVLASSEQSGPGARVTLYKNFEFQLPLALLGARLGSLLRLRFSVWRDHLPLDALPLEDWMEIPVVSEDEMEGSVYNYSPYS